MASCAWKLVLSEHGLLFHRLDLISRIRRRPAAAPVAPAHRLAAVAPRRNAARIDYLPLNVEPIDQEGITFILQILEDRSTVLTHEYGVRGIVVNTELCAHAVSLTDSVQSNPWSGSVRQVVVPRVRDRPARHRTVLDAKHQPARFGLFQEGNELGLEQLQIGIHPLIGVATHES